MCNDNRNGLISTRGNPVITGSGSLCALAIPAIYTVAPPFPCLVVIGRHATSLTCSQPRRWPCCSIRFAPRPRWRIRCATPLLLIIDCVNTQIRARRCLQVNSTETEVLGQKVPPPGRHSPDIGSFIYENSWWEVPN